MNRELFEALEAMCFMWNQYCPPPYGHMCMSAGEGAEGILDKYELLDKSKGGYGGVVDWNKLEELRLKTQVTE